MKLVSPFAYTLSCSLNNVFFHINNLFFLVSVPLVFFFFPLSPKLEPYALRSYFLFMYFSEDDTV